MDAYISEAAPVSQHFVVRFSGCDYNCPACNVPHLVEFKTEEQVSTRDITRLMDESGKAKVFFTGGEPLLQRQALALLLQHAKRRGLRTIIDTNGSKPDVLRSLLSAGLVDELRVDVKAPLPSFDKVTKASTFFKPGEDLFKEFEESLAVLHEYQDRVDLSFTTLVTPGLLYKKEDVLALAALLKDFQAQWTLVPFDPAVTLDPGLQGVAPPTRRFLETLASFVKKKYPGIDITVA